MPAMSAIEVQPDFDLEEFMNFAHESRISSEALDELAGYWEDWQQKLNAQEIKGETRSWLVVWLPESVEKIADAAWQRSPGEGYMLNNLAQYMCMSAVATVLPEAQDLGCVPTPEAEEALGVALENIGLAQRGRQGLLRRYAVLSYYPFRGGCEICALQEGCPKLGNQDMGSITLPGHEAGD